MQEQSASLAPLTRPPALAFVLASDTATMEDFPQYFVSQNILESIRFSRRVNLGQV